MRKSTLGLGTFLSLALIGPVLNEIHTLKNSKFTKKCIDVRTVCPAIHISLMNFQDFK